MGRIFGIGFFVVLIWVALEVYTEGVGGAFDGLLTRIPGIEASTDAAAPRSTPKRAADAFQRAYDQSEARIDRAMRRQDPASNN